VIRGLRHIENGDAYDFDYDRGDEMIMSEKTLSLKSPVHPGRAIRELCLEPLGLTVTRTAQALGVTRKTFSELLNGRAGVSPEMSLRLSIAFNTTPEFWLNMQREYDLAQAMKKTKRLKVEKLYSGEKLPNRQ
jgi:addiction module HigA family antidote